MARSPFLSLDPNLDLPGALSQIEKQRLAQTQGAQQFGTAADSKLGEIYGQLGGSLKQGTQAIQQTYAGAGDKIGAAYQQGTAGAAGASTQVQDRLRSMAQQLGLDPAALAEVSGRLGEQAAGFQFKNQQSMADRQASMAQLGAGMTAVGQLAEQASQKALAQGRTDLAKKVATEVQRANTLAAQAQTDFTGVKANQAAQAAAQAQKEAMSAMRQLSRGGGGGGGGGRSSGGGSAKWDPFELFKAKAEYTAGMKGGSSELDDLNAELASRVGAHASPNTIMHFQAAAASDNPMAYIAKLDPKKLKKEGVSKQILTKWTSGLR